MRKQITLLFLHPFREWIKKTPQEVLIIGSLVMIYVLHNVVVLTQMIVEIL